MNKDLAALSQPRKLKIAEEQLCVLVNGEEYRTKEERYSRAGRQVPVIRIVVLLFDAAASYCIDSLAHGASAELAHELSTLEGSTA